MVEQWPEGTHLISCEKCYEICNVIFKIVNNCLNVAGLQEE
jgi:hypothetical protein